MRRLNLFRQDLSLQILALYLLFVGPVIVGALVFNGFAGQRLRADVQQADIDLAAVIAQEINGFLGQTLEIVDQLAHHSVVINTDLVGVDELFRTLTIGRSEISVVYLLDNQCNLQYFFQPGVGPGEIPADISISEIVCRAEPEIAYVSNGHKSTISGQPVVSVVSPVRTIREGAYVGLVGIDLRLQALNDMAKLSVQHLPGEGFQVFFVDEMDQIVTRSDYNPHGLLIPVTEFAPPSVQDSFGAGEGTQIAPDLDGTELIFSFAPVNPSANWTVLVSRPTSLAFTTPQDFNRGVILALGIFSVIGLIFWILLSRRMIRPLERLSTYSQRIGRGGETAGNPGENLLQLSERPDQLGRLVRSLIRADEEIAARLTELSTLLETGAAVVSTLDLPEVLGRILEQVERLVGVEKCAIVALDVERGVFLSQASRGLSQSYVEQIIVHPDEPYSLTMQAITKGSPVQVSDIENDESRKTLLPRARTEGVRSMLAVPLKTLHAPQAVLVVYRPNAHVFTSQEINLVNSFAYQAAMAIENATLFARSDMALQEQTQRLEALVQSMQDGLILEDLQGKVLYANRAIADLAGLSPEKVLGERVNKLMDRIVEPVREKEKTLLAVQNALNRDVNRRVDIEFAEQGGVRCLRLSIFDVTDSNGVPIGRGRILQDVTRRRELDRMKSSLISTVSHELRTPLASIKGYTTTLLADDVEWDTLSQREFLSIISNETDRLTELVKDLLDMSRIEAGNLSISRLKSDLSEMINHAVNRATSLKSDSFLKERIRISLLPNIPALYVDPQRIVVVIRNLIENAVKYSAEGSPIHISAGREGDSVVFRIRDEGVGIPKEHSSRVFDSFYRVENGLTRTTRGAGLGLAICNGFVRAHGGEIWLEALEKGSCIAFSLPVEAKERVALEL